MNKLGAKICPYCSHKLNNHNMSNGGHGFNGDRCNIKCCLCDVSKQVLELLLS